MTTDSTTTARVYSYDTADVLDGTPSAELVEASLAAGDTGAVAAYLDGDVWRHVPDSMVSHYGQHLGETVVTVYVEAAAADEEHEPTVEIDIDSIEVFAPELDDDEEYDASEALNHCIGLDVTVDGREVRIGCVVGAPDSDHGTIRAAGGGVRPFCHAWWADSSDWQELDTQAERDAVIAALDAQSWALYQRACDEA